MEREDHPPLPDVPAGSFVVVPAGTRLYTAARTDSEHLMLGWPGGWGDFGRPTVLRVASARGEFLEVTTDVNEGDGHCVSPLRVFGPSLTMFVPAASLLRVTQRDIEINDAKSDSEAKIRVGSPVETRDGKVSVVGTGFDIRVPIPEDALGWFYRDPTPPPRSTPDPIGYITSTAPSTRAGTIDVDLRGRSVTNIEPEGDRVYVEARTSCVELVTTYSADHVVDRGRPGRALSGRELAKDEDEKPEGSTTDPPASWPHTPDSGTQGAFAGAGGRRVSVEYRVDSGVAVTWADGTAAGSMRDSATFNVPGRSVGDRVCMCPSISYVESSANFALCFAKSDVDARKVEGASIVRGMDPMQGCSK